MTTPIADGTYRIRNVQYPTSSINLTRGLPYAAINNWPNPDSANQQWIVKNIGNNQITLESASARGYYASVYNFSRAAPLFGSPNPTYFTVQQASTGTYRLVAGGFQLALTQEGRLATILLGPLYDTSLAQEQQWTFQRV